MIRCKLVEYVNPDATQSGARVDRAVAGEVLTLGRAAASKIYLPDPRVRMEHALIRHAEDGFLYLDASGPVLVNKRSAESTIRLAIGQQITLGPYEFAVEAVDDGPGKANAQLTLSFALRAVAPSATQQAQAMVPNGIVPGWFTRRRLGWLLSLLVLVFATAVPVWRAYDLQATPTALLQGDGLLAQTRVWVAVNLARLDTFWNPGQISSAHKGFAQECSSCHDKPFERVADTSCTTCHKTTGPHVADKALQHAAFAGERCATCHKEHQGTRGMRTVDAIGCESCHGNIKAHAPQSALANVSDFARDHPPFRLAIRTGPQPGAVVRTAQTETMRNDTGLKFPHDLHLAPGGIKSPTGPAGTSGRVVLGCANCHTLDAGGARYAPVRMARDCQGCHRLSVDAQAPERQVPHGDPAVVATAVREIFASLAVDRIPSRVVTVNSLLQRPNAAPLPSQAMPAGRFVEDRSRATLASMFEQPNGVCKTCHEIRKAEGNTAVAKAVPWSVAPVVMTSHWLPKSRFSHVQHTNAACSSCHEAEGSHDAAQVLIPPVQVCQTCHAGARTEDEKVVSRCDSCHSFHIKTDNPIFRKPVVISGGKT